MILISLIKNIAAKYYKNRREISLSSLKNINNSIISNINLD